MPQQLVDDFPIDPLTTSGDELADILNRFEAAVNSSNSGGSAPPDTSAGMVWLDTSGATPVLRIRNADNTGWGTIPVSGGSSGTGAPFMLPDGTLAAPGLAFASEPGLGWYRNGSGQISVAQGGVKISGMSASGNDAFFSMYAKGAGGRAAISANNQPFGSANHNQLNIQASATEYSISGQNTGTATDKPMQFTFPAGVGITGPLGVSGNITSQAAIGAAGNITAGGTAVVHALNLDIQGALFSYDANTVYLGFINNWFFGFQRSTGNLGWYRPGGPTTTFTPGGDFMAGGNVWAGVDTSVGLVQNGSFPYVRFSADNWRLQMNRGDGSLTWCQPAGAQVFIIGGGGNVNMSGSLTAAGTLMTNSTSTEAVNLNNGGWIRLHQPGVGIKYLRTEGNNFQVLNQAGAAAALSCTDPGRLYMNQGYATKNGMDGGFGANCYNWMWDGSNMYLFIENGNQGYVQRVSDARLKKDITPLVSSEEAFMALAPVSYRWETDEVLTDTAIHHGFTAQNVRESWPEATLGNFDDDPTPREGHVSFPASMDDRAVMAHVVLRVQDLINRVQHLERT